MKLANILLPAALLAFTLAACQQQSDDNIAIDETNTANAHIETLPPDESVASNDEGNASLNEADDAGSEQPSPPGTPEASMIPGQYRGRWGMVAADCEQGRSDAKGLITIGEKTIRFYESTATLKQQRPAIATSFAGLFAFTGEGQSWQKVMTFTRTGDTLKRAEEEGTFTYKRCT
jgi:hypothetical protein